jgi:hypothetical protein
METNFICNKCNSIFKQKKNLIKHQNKKNPCDKKINIIKCDYCYKTLSNKTKISNHLKTCKVYNQYDLNKQKENNNKEIQVLSDKIEEIEDIFNDKIEEIEINFNNKLEEQNIKIEEQKNIYETKIIELKKELEELKSKNNKINKKVNILKDIIKEEKKKVNKNSYDKINISKEDRIRYLKNNLNIYELVVDKFIKTYYVNEKKPENHLLYISDKNRNKIKYYQGNKWIDGDKRIILRQVMRNCIMKILNIDKNDEEEIRLENNIWKNTSENSIDLLYLRSAFSLVDDEGKVQFKKIYNTILNIMSMAIYSGKTMIGETIKKDKKIKKIIKDNMDNIDILLNDESINDDKIEDIELDLGHLCI